MNTTEIERFLANDKRTAYHFRGVYACDKLPLDAPTSSLYICNTDHSYSPGEHWIAIYIDDKRRAEFFDSFGMHPTVWHFESFLNRNSKSWTCNITRVQNLFSNACGYHCIFYGVHRCSGFDMNAIINMFTIDTAYNDAVVKQFVHNKLQR